MEEDPDDRKSKRLADKGRVQNRDGSDVELLRRIAGSDLAAFGELYDQYASILISIAYKILTHRNDAEDVIQEVFLQVWTKASSFDSHLGRPFGWLLTLTRNKAVDRLRILHRQYHYIEDALQGPLAGSDSESPPETFSREKLDLIRAAIGALPSNQREPIEMAFFGGMTHAEVSALLKEPLGTVKARIRRGLIHLRKSLGNQSQDGGKKTTNPG